MQVKYSTTFRDYKAAQTLHAKRSEISYLTHCVGHYFYPMIGICVLVFEFTPHHLVDSPQPKLISTLCGLILVSIPVYLRLMMRRSYTRTRTGDGECIIDFNEEAIRMQGLHTKSEVDWGAIKSFSEDDKGFLLYFAPGRFLAIPKRVCTEEQVNELRTLLQSKVTNDGVAV